MVTLRYGKEEIRVCTRDEFRGLWRDKPELRGRLFLEEEASLLLSEELKDRREPSPVLSLAVAAKQKDVKLIINPENIGKIIKK